MFPIFISLILIYQIQLSCWRHIQRLFYPILQAQLLTPFTLQGFVIFWYFCRSGTCLHELEHSFWPHFVNVQCHFLDSLTHHGKSLRLIISPIISIVITKSSQSRGNGTANTLLQLSVDYVPRYSFNYVFVSRLTRMMILLLPLLKTLLFRRTRV